MGELRGDTFVVLGSDGLWDVLIHIDAGHRSSRSSRGTCSVVVLGSACLLV
jgi:hypothetical protein